MVIFHSYVTNYQRVNGFVSLAPGHLGLLAERFSVAHWPPIPRWERCDLAWIPRPAIQHDTTVYPKSPRKRCMKFYNIIWYHVCKSKTGPLNLYIYILCLGQSQLGYPLYPMLAQGQGQTPMVLWYSVVFSWLPLLRSSIHRFTACHAPFPENVGARLPAITTFHVPVQVQNMWRTSLGYSMLQPWPSDVISLEVEFAAKRRSDCGRISLKSEKSWTKTATVVLALWDDCILASLWPFNCEAQTSSQESSSPQTVSASDTFSWVSQCSWSHMPFVNVARRFLQRHPVSFMKIMKSFWLTTPSLSCKPMAWIQWMLRPATQHRKNGKSPRGAPADPAKKHESDSSVLRTVSSS